MEILSYEEASSYEAKQRSLVAQIKQLEKSHQTEVKKLKRTIRDLRDNANKNKRRHQAEILLKLKKEGTLDITFTQIAELLFTTPANVTYYRKVLNL